VGFNVREAKTQFSRLLARVERGESVVIAGNGRPVADLVPYRMKDAEVNRQALDGDWWNAMSDGEAEDLFEGR
jgi:prevent-host-death family protein